METIRVALLPPPLPPPKRGGGAILTILESKLGGNHMKIWSNSDRISSLLVCTLLLVLIGGQPEKVAGAAKISNPALGNDRPQSSRRRYGYLSSPAC